MFGSKKKEEFENFKNKLTLNGVVLVLAYFIYNSNMFSTTIFINKIATTAFQTIFNTAFVVLILSLLVGALSFNNLPYLDFMDKKIWMWIFSALFDNAIVFLLIPIAIFAIVDVWKSSLAVGIALTSLIIFIFVVNYLVKYKGAKI